MFYILGSFRLFRILDIFGEFVNAWRASCSPPAPGHAAIHVLQLFARKLSPPLFIFYFFFLRSYLLFSHFHISYLHVPFHVRLFLQDIPPPPPPPPQFLNVDSSSSPPLRYRTATGRQCQILDEAPKQGQML